MNRVYFTPPSPFYTFPPTHPLERLQHQGTQGTRSGCGCSLWATLPHRVRHANFSKGLVDRHRNARCKGLGVRKPSLPKKSCFRVICQFPARLLLPSTPKKVCCDYPLSHPADKRFSIPKEAAAFFLLTKVSASESSQGGEILLRDGPKELTKSPFPLWLCIR